jgi:hypothetical protein
MGHEDEQEHGGESEKAVPKPHGQMYQAPSVFVLHIYPECCDTIMDQREIIIASTALVHTSQV